MRQVGGQAIIDGIVMVGKKCTAIVRRKSSGRMSIETRSECISNSKNGIEKIILFRGINYFFKLIKEMVFNLNFYEVKNENESEDLSFLNKVLRFLVRSKNVVFLIGIIFVTLILFIIPEGIINILPNSYTPRTISLIKFVIRLGIIFTYMLFVSNSKDFSGILKYHGAEHKVINCYEQKNELTVDNVRKSSRFHKKCGSNFVVFVIICYFIIFLFVPRFSIGINVLIELLILPIVLGVVFEIIEYVGRSNSVFSSAIFSISKIIQGFVTKEPSDDEIEVAIAALKTSEGLKIKNTIKEVFLIGRGILRDAKIESYALDSRLILEYCLGVTPTQVFTSEAEVSKEDEEKYLSLIDERKNGKPIAYMVGKKEFYGNDFIVKEGVLIPRADTEVLVEKVLDILKYSKGPISLCDLCSGSGAVGISIQKNNALVNCTYVDNYEIPLKVNEENVYMYDLKDRSYIVKSNLLEFFIKNGLELDGIVSNPPYIRTDEIGTLMKDVKNFEPHEALDGGEDGLNYYRIISEQAAHVLIDGGFLAFEIPHNKAFDVMYIMTNNNFVNIDIYKDINEKDRVIIGYYKRKI